MRNRNASNDVEIAGGRTVKSGGGTRQTEGKESTMQLISMPAILGRTDNRPLPEALRLLIIKLGGLHTGKFDLEDD